MNIRVIEAQKVSRLDDHNTYENFEGRRKRAKYNIMTENSNTVRC